MIRSCHISVLFFLAFLAGCGRIAVYSDASLQNEVGLKYYAPKPYLLVSRTGAKDKPTEISVIYLPDLSQPYYAKLKPGMGSADLKMEFTNAVLTSVGQNTDPQIDELITSIGGLATSARTAIAPVPQAAPLPELAARLNVIAEDLREVLKSSAAKKYLTGNEMQILANIARQLTDSSTVLGGPDGPVKRSEEATKLESALKIWTTGIGSSATGEPNSKSLRDTLNQLRAELERTIQEIKGQASPRVELDLYEVRITPEGTELHKVIIQ